MVLSLAVLAAALAGWAAPAQAQYFGRQKVQYEDFDWRILETDRFEVHFYPEEATAAQDGARMVERWYTRLSGAFQHEFDKKPVIFYADHPDFQQTSTTPGGLSEGTGGFTDALRNRIVMPFTGVYAENDHVIGHELVHVFQYDLATSPGGGGLMGMSRLPGWLIEGMAEYLSLGRVDAHTAMWLRDAALRGELPTIQELTRDTRYFPYRYGQALWAFIAGRWGDRAVPELYRFATRTGWEDAVQRVLGATTGQISQEWIAATREQYLPLLVGKQRPEDAGTPVLVEDEIGAMNLSPVVSPDGRYVAFFGRREVFTVDLLVADAQTGRIVKKLTSPGRSAHFDALSFIYSAGTWSPDGRKFAFVVFAGGDQQISILDVNSGDTERSITVEGVGGVSNPSWSPDGRSIAFSGMAGGISDLYVLDLESSQVRQLTNDRYADLQPNWSPDGRTLVFATDRGPTTDFRSLVYGNMQLATYDVAAGGVQLLDIFPAGKHINPQYSPDGRSIFFIADPDGFSNVYRLDLGARNVHQVTNVATGISGITDLSPAMSVAARTGRMLFSVFEKSGTNVYGIDAERTVGTPVDPSTATAFAPAATLPPGGAAGTGMVTDYLADVATGLPPAGTTFPTRDYDAGLQLEYVGPPSFGVGMSSFGTGVAGGVSLFFGDMLGGHQLGAAIQANGTFKDIGGMAAYTNTETRWNWGAMGGHVPYLTGYAFVDVDDLGYRMNQVLQRVYVDQLGLFTQYPFSQTRRFEVNVSGSRYAFNQEARQFYYDPFTGQQLSNVIESDLPSPDPLYFVQGGVALVGDNSYFGFTSPVAGQRYRLEVSPTIGTFNYQTVLADFRRYQFMSPFTFAIRGLHYGRYGSDAVGITADNERILSPLFLGYETFVRGYASESIDATECRPTETSSCPVFDRLLGSRIAVASAELRVPLFGVSEFGLINLPFLPTEIAPFVDVGYAWGDIYARDDPRNDIKREMVSSVGLSARINLLGYLVLETYYAYPFQRPDKRGHIGFNLMPGW